MTTAKNETEDRQDPNERRERGGQSDEDRSKGLDQGDNPFDDSESDSGGND